MHMGGAPFIEDQEPCAFTTYSQNPLYTSFLFYFIIILFVKSRNTHTISMMISISSDHMYIKNITFVYSHQHKYMDIL